MKLRLLAPILSLLAGILTGGCHPRGKWESPTPSLNILSFNHYEFGPEKFQVYEPRCNLDEASPGLWELTIITKTNAALERAKQLDETVSNARPWFEATVVIKGEKPEMKAGQAFHQPAGYDYERDINISNFYYFSHRSVEDLRIEVLAVDEEWLELRVNGMTIVNGSKGTEPDAKFSLQAKFKRDAGLQRGVQ